MLLKSNNSQNSSNAFEKLRALEDILRSRGLSYTFLEPPSEVDKNTNLLVQCDNCLMSFSKQIICKQYTLNGDRAYVIGSQKRSISVSNN